jgi:hypothetical protein
MSGLEHWHCSNYQMDRFGAWRLDMNVVGGPPQPHRQNFPCRVNVGGHQMTWKLYLPENRGRVDGSLKTCHRESHRC